MSKLQELINKLCPNGVEFKPLGELGTFENIGVDKKSNPNVVKSHNSLKYYAKLVNQQEKTNLKITRSPYDFFESILKSKNFRVKLLIISTLCKF